VYALAVVEVREGPKVQLGRRDLPYRLSWDEFIAFLDHGTYERMHPGFFCGVVVDARTLPWLIADEEQFKVCRPGNAIARIVLVVPAAIGLEILHGNGDPVQDLQIALPSGPFAEFVDQLFDGRDRSRGLGHVRSAFSNNGKAVKSRTYTPGKSPELIFVSCWDKKFTIGSKLKGGSMRQLRRVSWVPER
jgi:hypothetical protein